MRIRHVSPRSKVMIAEIKFNTIVDIKKDLQHRISADLYWDPIRLRILKQL
jgi:hypothetical protein